MTIEFCHRCGRAVRRSLIQRLFGIMPLCDDKDWCDSIHASINDDPPPELVDLDDRPTDIDYCINPNCEGGEVPVRQDWETGGWETKECWACHGTGTLTIDDPDNWGEYLHRRPQ